MMCCRCSVLWLVWVLYQESRFDRVIGAINPLAEDAVSVFSLVHVHREVLLLAD